MRNLVSFVVMQNERIKGQIEITIIMHRSLNNIFWIKEWMPVNVDIFRGYKSLKTNVYDRHVWKNRGGKSQENFTGWNFNSKFFNIYKKFTYLYLI